MGHSGRARSPYPYPYRWWLDGSGIFETTGGSGRRLITVYTGCVRRSSFYTELEQRRRRRSQRPTSDIGKLPQIEFNGSPQALAHKASQQTNHFCFPARRFWPCQPATADRGTPSTLHCPFIFSFLLRFIELYMPL